MEVKKGTKTSKKVKKITKMSELSINLDEPSELTKLVESHKESLSKAIREIFQLEAEFDKCTIYKMKGPSHNLPYGNAIGEENGNFSPVVAILPLGLPETRPMFLRTIAGSQVTHKVALKSGCLCVLSGRTEVRYKRAIPKDYGNDSEQYYLVLEQKTPEASILKELQKISIPPKTNKQDSSNGVTMKPTPVMIPSNNNLEESKTEQNLYLKTPPTVVRVTSAGDSLPFHDNLDYETSGELLLAETISAVVEKMDEKTVDTELLRSQTSTVGSLDVKRKRLQQKICMSIGELSMSANNSLTHGMNFSRCGSPDIASAGHIKDDIESVINAQKCMESAVTKIIESIVDIKSEVVKLKEETPKNSTNQDKVVQGKQQNNVQIELTELRKEVNESSKRVIELLRNKDLPRTMKELSGKVDDLTKNTEKAREDLRLIREGLTDLRENAVATMKESVNDMAGYYNSVFSDESKELIKDIHKYVEARMVDKDVQTDKMDWVDWVPLDWKPQNEQRNPQSEQRNPQNEQRNPQSEQRNPAANFNFPDRIVPTLKKVLESNEQVKVWLITDSIMRHVNEFSMQFRKHRINLQRVDRRCSSSLVERRLEKEIAKQKPHIIYVHLGINDIHAGTHPQEIINNFKYFKEMLLQVSPASKMIISCPLLNGKTFNDRHVFSLRHSLYLFQKKQEETEEFVDPTQRRTFIQKNDKFFYTSPTPSIRVQNPKYFDENDQLHLSDKGKSAIICTMRDTLHTILKDLTPLL